MPTIDTMLAFDTETTGVDVEADRIVTACAAIVGSQPPVVCHWLANPGVSIPPAATAVHGVTAERAQAEGARPATVVTGISNMLAATWAEGRPVVGFNVCYDLTILDREMRRHLGRGLAVAGPVIDPLVLDRAADPYRKGSRKLSAVAAHYGVRHEGAHSADGDALAAARLAWVMLRRVPELAAMSLAELYAYQTDAHAKWAANFANYLRSQGRTDDLPDGAWPLRPWGGS
jgi:DNA polymerase-3 subunit epsilon